MRRAAAGIAILIALVAATLPAAATAAPRPQVNYQDALTQFMCTGCHEPLNQVNSEEAYSEKEYLAQLIDDGLNMPEIRTAMVQQYGEAVLAAPPASGFNLTVYILPPAVLIAGALLIALTIPKWRERSRQTRGAPASPTARPTDADAARLDAELERFV